MHNQCGVTLMRRGYQMKQRSPPSLQFIVVAAAAASTDTIIMSSRPRYTAGRNQWRRGYSDRNSGDQSVTDPNGSSRSDNHSKFRPQTRSPSSFNPNAPPYNPNQQFRPPAFYPNQNQQFRPPPFYQNQNQQFRPPPFYQNQNQNQQFGPPHLQQNQQFRPRPAKPLDYRNWEFAKPGPPPDCERFTILSYNILADYLAINHRSKLYYHIPRHILDWEFRRRSIIFELGLWSADILCFQEVDRFQDLEMDLKVRGYTGIWKMRTGDPVDGCAVFWRVSRFKLLHEESIEFNKLGLRDNVAQICVFESMNQSLDHKRNTSGPSESAAGHKKVVICNIHVLYNPKRGEIKLGQVRILLERAHAVSKLWDNAPVVLCGDFNCTPQSPLYTFISEQKLNLSELPRDKLSGQASAEIRPEGTVSPSVSRGPPGNSSARAPSTVEPNTEVHQGKDVSKDETGSNQCVPVTALNEQIISSQTEAGFSVGQLKGEVSEDSLLNSHQEDIQANNRSVDLLHDIPSLNVLEASYHENSRSGSSLDNDCADISYASTATVECEKLENLSLIEPFEATEGDEILGENCDTFLSELHDEDETEASNELLSSPQQLASSPEPFYVERYAYDPSAWTPMEIEKATGSSECSLIEHPLKLRSTYSQVENPSGTRDSNGEPLVTSYNRCFLGTVDYIWCSQGLQTVRVLAPIPRHAMQWTPGFPTKKWGSDHIALVSELAFTKDVNLENAGE